jgi:hypothetical protein
MTHPPPRQARAGMTKRLPRIEFRVVPEDAFEAMRPAAGAAWPAARSDGRPGCSRLPARSGPGKGEEEVFDRVLEGVANQSARSRRRRTQTAAVQILLDELEHAFSCRDKTDDAHRVDFGLDTERRLGLTSREAIYQACPIRFQPIIMSTMAAGRSHWHAGRRLHVVDQLV